MNAEQIAALQPGPELDRLVHEHVFGKSGRRKTWSTTNICVEIIEALPVAAGRRPSTDPGYKEDRPFWGGIIEPIESEEDGQSYVTNTRVFCATLPIALCKIGLIEAFARKSQKNS